MIAAAFVEIKPKVELRPIDNLWRGVEVMNDARFSHVARAQEGSAMKNAMLPK